MSQSQIENACNIIAFIQKKADITNSENIKNLFLNGGIIDVSVKDSLSKLISLVDNELYRSSFILKLDGCKVDLTEPTYDSEIKNSTALEWELTIKKDELLKLFDFPSTTISEFLFFSVDKFKSFTGQGLGLSNPLILGELNTDKPVRIHVYELPVSFGGSRLAVVPVGQAEGKSSFLQPSPLPKEENLKKAIHIVSTESVVIRPSSFELTWGDIEHELAKPFLKAFIQVLYACIASQIFSLKKVVLNGVKQIELSIDGQDFEPSSVNKLQAQALSKLVSWCFAEDDFDTRRLLIADRLSLECKGGTSLLSLTERIITEAFEQAKSKYRYVISERNDDYRKELKDVYEDIKSFSDDYATRSINLTKGLIADLLSIAFVFSMGVFAKATVYNDLLKSGEANILFKAIAIYLLCSFSMRYWHVKIALTQNNKLFEEWSGKLHNHIALDEVRSIKERLTRCPKDHFITTSAIVGASHFFLAFLSWESESFLRFVGLW